MCGLGGAGFIDALRSPSVTVLAEPVSWFRAWFLEAGASPVSLQAGDTEGCEVANRRVAFRIPLLRLKGWQKCCRINNERER